MELTGAHLSPPERERIIRSMIELCAERGFEETTVADVIERAEVSEETFAELFASKEICARRAHNVILGEVVTIVAASYSAERSELDNLIAGTKALLEFMAAQPSVAHFGYITARQMGSRALHDSYEAGVRPLTAMLDRSRERSENQAAPEETSRGALGGAEAIVRREIVAGRTDCLPELLPDLVYSVAVPFLGQGEALRLAARSRDHVHSSGGLGWS